MPPRLHRPPRLRRRLRLRLHLRPLAASLLGLAVLLAFAGGCKSDDPFTADMKMICAAGGGGGGEALPPQMRKLAAMKEIASNIKTAEAARLVTRWAQVAPEERAEVVREALAKAGLQRCTFLE